MARASTLVSTMVGHPRDCARGRLAQVWLLLLMPSLASRECAVYGGLWPLKHEGKFVAGVATAVAGIANCLVL
ncbi:hypothetical protein Q4E40_09440 [Pontibacter sp. BT731]|uniref:hypothetical protein n=1 Tax=Pontibacter coccineus TaxID=3063328 RepID=UPI0026E311C8|nr:hypothetical protein [Pontibacter sp. BT731]MDO6390349.1 hypothetical protein [Pontibacter sp. BT731]